MKDIFEKLLDQLKEKELISEDQKTEYISNFDSGINKIKESAIETALETVDGDHAEKFTEAVEKIDEDHTNKLQTLMEKIDEDHTQKLQDVVDAIDEDHGEKLERIIEKVTEDIDEDHGSKLQEILEKIDTDHTQQLQEVINKIDSDHTEKLNKVVNHFNEKEDTKITDQVSEYLDAYLEEVKPTNTIVDSGKMKRLEKMFEGLKEILMVNDDHIQDEVKEAILDAQSIIESKDKEINKLMLEKVQLTKKIRLDEAQIVLEDRISGSSPKLKAYLETTFKDASKETIEEKFDEAVTAFANSEQTRRDEILETEASKIIPRKVITENLVDERTVPTQMDSYVNMVKKSLKLK